VESFDRECGWLPSARCAFIDSSAMAASITACV
jgi:hypothetical protein